MQPGDRLVTALVGTHHAGETFGKAWLLHVTIVAWFKSGLSSEEIARQLGDRLQGIKPFSATMGGEEHLGFGGKALVNIVQLPSPFMEIQKRVEQALDELGVEMTGTRGTWDGPYKPHVTVQESGRLQEGETFQCDRLYIVSQQGAFHNIDAEIPLA
jgi:hypothetical protein